MPHIAVNVNMLTDIDVELVSEYRRAKVILCREITNSVTRALWASSTLSGCGQHLMPKNLGGNMTLPTSPFRKILRGHVRTVPENMPVKFEVRSFNCFGAISI